MRLLFLGFVFILFHVSCLPALWLGFLFLAVPARAQTPIDFQAIQGFIADFTHIYDYSRLVTAFGQIPTGAYFTIQVADESFCLYSTNPDTIRLATQNYYGLNTTHPTGPVRAGDGGFNYGFGGLPQDKYWRYWSWHLDPQTTVMAEATIEICDGLPSAVEYGPLDIGTYCPWNAHVTALDCPSPN